MYGLFLANLSITVRYSKQTRAGQMITKLIRVIYRFSESTTIE